MAENITARDLMRPTFLRMGAAHTLREAMGVLLDPQARREDPRVIFVLNSDGTLAGVLSPKDLLNYLLGEWAKRGSASPTAKEGEGESQILIGLQEKLNESVSLALNRDVPIASPDDRLPRLIHAMQSKRLECLPVVEGGRVVGLVLLTDVFNAAAALALGAQGQ